MAKTANVYIDGFNLYYGALKSHPSVKWLDLEGLGNELTPRSFALGRVYYFTARVNGVTDSGAPLRQDKFLKATTASPRVEAVEGSFKTRKGSYPLASDTQQFATIVRTEEKGSDVNLASYLLRDAHLGACNAAVVVSDDFDLLAPLMMAKQDFGLQKIIVASPRCRNYLARKAKADQYRPIKSATLKANQMPDPVNTAAGPVSRPSIWS